MGTERAEQFLRFVFQDGEMICWCFACRSRDRSKYPNEAMMRRKYTEWKLQWPNLEG